ncbi:MAG: hypothetical protein AVDCRST_MAG51-2631, partial [uncultured Ramlibacter sp.]
ARADPTARRPRAGAGRDPEVVGRDCALV